MEERTCTRCSETKQITSFPRKKNAQGKYYYRRQCSKCHSHQCYLSAKRNGRIAKRYRAKQGTPEQKYRTFLSTCKRYGTPVLNFTLDDFKALIAQKTQCEICQSTDRLCIDHNHSTGLVRGRLCFRCNSALGYFQDNTERLGGALQYLRKNGGAAGCMA